MPFFGGTSGGGGGGGGGGSDVTTVNDEVTTAEDTPVSGNVLTNDSTLSGTLRVLEFRLRLTGAVIPTRFEPGDVATIAGVGTFTCGENGAWTATPAPDFAGVFPTVTYFVTNGHEVKVATVTVTVTAANDPPIANDDARITPVNTPITINVVSNDRDPDGNAITVTHINATPVSVGVGVDVGDGTATWQGSGAFLVTPDADFLGTITFGYTLTDGSATDTGTVTVLVGVSNDPMHSAAAPIVGDQGLAAQNFGLTYMNRVGNAWNNGVNVAAPPWSANQGLFVLTNREPWLYDRASTVYGLYRRTQDPTILDHAIALADAYMAGVEVVGGLGRFTIVGGDNGANPADVKYLYPKIAVWYERETGSSVHRSKGIALYNQAIQSFAATYDPQSAALWTERNAGFRTEAAHAAYWLHRSNGDIAAANTALADAWATVTMVEGMSAATGAPMHGHNQHEGSAITTPISSPWMAAFYAEAITQLYRTDPQERVLTWLSNYGQWLLANAFYVADGSEHAGLAGLRLPAYLAATTGTPTTFREGEGLDFEHAADVAGLIRKVIWARTILGLSTAAYTTLLGELDAAAVVCWAYHTRTTEGYPRYRVMPPRKYGWWFAHNYSNESLFFTERVPTKPLNLLPVVISGSTQSGQELSASQASTWDAYPVPVVTYQWTRNGVNIPGATAATYTTVVADEGTAVRRVDTATNAAGATSNTSNAINVVAAGAPEITVHPLAASGTVGGTVQFTATCTATPAATFQWQRSTNGGGSWSNVVGGTGGSGSGNTTTYTTPALVEGDNGALYRCVFTNVAGSATTNSGALSMVVDQGSARFESNTQGAQLTFDMGDVGHANLTMELLLYVESRTSNASWLGFRHLGNGRAMGIWCNNTFEQHNAGPADTQTGVTPWATQIPANTWVHVTLQAQTVGGGDQVRATWTVAEGAAGTRYAQTRANGVENSVQAQAIFVGGSAIGQLNQGAIRVQYVRARSEYLADAVVDAHRQDVTTTGWAFWWRFYNNAGVLAVEDKTGNNRVPTIAGGTFATGPVVPGVP